VSLWSQAQTSAQNSLAIFRQEAQENVTESLQAVATADQARLAAEAESNQTREALRAANERILDLERDLAGERARTQSLEQQIELARHQQTTLEVALAEARKDYSAELEKSRQELRRTEERLESNEKRALLEIDHERQMTVKVQRELLQIRNSSLENEEQLRIELASSKAELANVRQMLGVAEGKQDELRTGKEKQLEELVALRQTLGKQETRLALLQREVELAQTASKQIQENIALKSGTPKVPRRNRKI
jgi:chromosome segregation ATPase